MRTNYVPNARTKLQRTLNTQSSLLHDPWVYLFGYRFVLSYLEYVITRGAYMGP